MASAAYIGLAIAELVISVSAVFHGNIDLNRHSLIMATLCMILAKLYQKDG